MVNDYYGEDVVNIKDGEQANRAQKFLGGESQNVYPHASKQFPSINQFKSFFKNKANKRRLQSFLKNELSQFAVKDSRTIIYCTRNECDNISVLPFNPECAKLRAQRAQRARRARRALSTACLINGVPCFGRAFYGRAFSLGLPFLGVPSFGVPFFSA